MAVHNHGTEQGKGLACSESLIGECLIKEGGETIEGLRAERDGLLATIEQALDSNEVEGVEHDAHIWLDEANRILDSIRAIVDDGPAQSLAKHDAEVAAIAVAKRSSDYLSVAARAVRSAYKEGESVLSEELTSIGVHLRNMVEADRKGAAEYRKTEAEAPMSELPEQDATPDEAFELGRVAGYSEAIGDGATSNAEAWDEGVEAHLSRRERDVSLPLTNPYRKTTESGGSQ